MIKFKNKTCMAISAFELCQFAHNSIGQTRKYSGEDYWKHPAEVALITKRYTRSVEAECAAYLHDVLEDVKPINPFIDENLIKYTFGEEVLKLVLELTDISTPGDGNRAARKAMDREHTKASSPLAKLVKCADLLDNARSIKKYDAGFWKVYKEEVNLLLPCLEASKEVDASRYRKGVYLYDRLFNEINEG